MIITKTPLRISFLGGGTDFPIFIKNNKFGCVISSTINKFIYVSVKQHGSVFNEKYRLNYSDTEVVNSKNEIKNDIIRSALEYLKIRDSIYVSTISDLPSNTGLGSSSAFCVGLLNALYHYIGKKVSKQQLALDAFYIEKEVLAKSVGYQDHFNAVYGGFNYIKFYKNRFSINNEKNKKKISRLFSHLVCFDLNQLRHAEEILKDQIKNYKNNYTNLVSIKNLTMSGYQDLKNDDFISFFKKIDLSWQQKKQLSKKISNNKFNKAYDICINNGAYGGKISGAGGGGFLNIFCQKNKKLKITNKLKRLGYKNIEINYYPEGSKVIKV